MIKFSIEKELHPIKMSKDDLINLLNMITKNSKIDDFYGNMGFPKFRCHEHDVEKFLNFNEDVKFCDDLSIDIYMHDDSKENRQYVRIILCRFITSMEVEGDDEIWVLGKFQQISNFFQRKKPWFSLFYKFLWAEYLMCVLFWLLTIKNFRYQITNLIVFGIAAIWLSIITLLISLRKFFPYARVIFIPQKPLNWDTIRNVILIAGLIVTVIGSIIIPLLKK